MATFLGYEPRRAIRAVVGQRLLGVGAAPARRRPGAAAPTGHGIEWVEDPDCLVTAYARRPAQVVLIGTQRADSTGAELTRRLLSVFPAAVVVVLGAAADRHAQHAALMLGAHGFLRLDDLCAPDPARAHALLAAAAAEPATPAAEPATIQPPALEKPRPAACECGPAPLAAPAQDSGPGGHINGVGLTGREHQILTGMSQGLTNAAIAAELYVSEDTVKTHARRLYRKLNVHERGAAVAAGFRRRLLT